MSMADSAQNPTSAGEGAIANESSGQSDYEVDEAAKRRIRDWQNRLLQLDRRNNLLYYRPRKTTVGIVGIAPDELLERLEQSKRGLEFPYVPAVPSRQGFASQRPEEASPRATAEIRPGDLATDCEPLDLQRRLRQLRQREREWHEEQGLNVLFLAVGFLNWLDQEGESVRSPVLLIPCGLERASPGEPFRLQHEDEDPVVNSTLQHQLRLLDISFPEFGGNDNEEASVDEYLNEITERVRHRPGWSVDSDVVLGTFSYSKLAMYEDLERMHQNGPRSELVRLLAGATSSTARIDQTEALAAPSERDLAGGRLDDLLDLQDQYTVLPADFSQLRAIEEARQGRHLVIHGPPGTGKSQTIANLIATLIAEDRRVLFVSEKTAALDVVKRRLEESHLGVFCLDLHSERGKKREVYRQLQEALEDERLQYPISVDMNELLERRSRLNRAVRLLHERHEPMGLSAYEAQGHLAQVRHYPPFEALELPLTSRMTAQWLREAEEAVGRIERRPTEFREHHSSRWRVLRTPQRALQLADLIRSDMAAVQSAVATLRKESAPHTEWLGVLAIESGDDARRIVRLLRLLGRAPSVPRAWLSQDSTTMLRQQSQVQAKQQSKRRRIEAALSPWFESMPLDVDYRAMADAVRLSRSEQKHLERTVGPAWQSALGNDPASLLDRAHGLVTASEHLLAAARSVAALLTGPHPVTLRQIYQESDLTTCVLALDPFPASLLALSAIDRLDTTLGDDQALLKQLTSAEGQVMENFDAGLVDLVNDEMLVRYRTDHQSVWKRLFAGAYRRDQRTLRGQLKTPRKLTLTESHEIVALALKVQQLREKWRETEIRLQDALGSRFRGRETNWEGVRADISALRGILTGWTGDTSTLRELLAAEAAADGRQALDVANQKLRECLGRYRNATEAIGHHPLADSEAGIAEVASVAREALEPIGRITRATGVLYGAFARQLDDLKQLTQIVKDGMGIMAIMEEEEQLAPDLAETFGHFFQREATDWDVVSNAIDWTEDFREAAQNGLSGTLQSHAIDPRPREVYQEHEESISRAITEYAQSRGVLNARFDLAPLGWNSWGAVSFVDLEAWSADLHGHADNAASWVEYRDAVREFEERFGEESVVALRNLTADAGDAPGIVRRRIYTTWLEDIYRAKPSLGAFSRVDHEEIRSKFRELDEAFPFAARQRVRECAFSKYPDQSSFSMQAGQLNMLRRELLKKRRQLSVRNLIARAPKVIQALKPCFLMSPLAVSQHLSWGTAESGQLDFDIVIFDEASQVLPEDAIPAIDRARQAIVVGDQKQLPPTAFFRHLADDPDIDGDLETDDDQASTDGLRDVESILDVMVGMVGAGFAESELSMHYRSRHEGLISFSNHMFYGNRLLTFPSPDPAFTGVHDVFLPDGTYDAGGTSTNRSEAERVVDIVFEYMENLPRGESLGVVALSRKQCDLIETLIEARRQLRRDMDDWFSDDLGERFFVKNLENVQGDERDHIILSIGYGPTLAGRVYNRFGPLNRDGGERRLNVAVSRARMSMTVVHSLRAEQITSEQIGARQLRRFLEYVRDPVHSFEAEVSSLGEPESPFEDAVFATLRRRGHRVDAQVGISGYRIDLAVKAEDGERYDLGIECDGATYHSSPAARDRDWLRQQVLERLGWQIHRVWSTAWLRDPEAEVIAIERALARARAGQLQPLQAFKFRSVLESSNEESTPSVAIAAADEVHALTAEVSLFDDYRQFKCEPRRGDLRYVPWRDLVELVAAVTKVEQPVHVDMVTDRIRSTYGNGRAAKTARMRIKQAAKQSVESGVLGWDDASREFLRLSDSQGLLRPRRDGERSIGRIAPSEIDAALLLVASVAFGSERNELVRETARQFGWRRVGREIDLALSGRVESLLASGQLLLQGDTLVVSDDVDMSALRHA